MLDPTYDRDFAYDDLNRLTTANSGASLWGAGSYRYDAMGNMLARDLGGTVEVDPNDPLVRTRPFATRSESLPAPGSTHETYAYSGTTSKLATVTWDGIDHPMTYDAAGNEIRYFDTRTYSPRNAMTSISEPSEENTPHTVNYTYDGRGVRTIRSEGTAGYATPFATRYYIYSPELQLLAMSADDNPNVWGKHAISHVVPTMKSEIAWFNGRPVAQRDALTTFRYTFTDHLGTPILQTDFPSSVIWRAEYEPYGDLYTLRTGTTASEQPLRFLGQEYERKWEGAEERYNVFRWYRAGWGRYTQGDPVGLDGGLNVFGYAGSNPLLATDPRGLAYRSCQLYPPKDRRHPRLPAGDEPRYVDFVRIPNLEGAADWMDDLLGNEASTYSVFTKRRCTWRCYCESPNRTCYSIPCDRSGPRYKGRDRCRLDHGVTITWEFSNPASKGGVAPCSTFTPQIVSEGDCEGRP